MFLTRFTDFNFKFIVNKQLNNIQLFEGENNLFLLNYRQFQLVGVMVKPEIPRQLALLLSLQCSRLLSQWSMVNLSLMKPSILLSAMGTVRMYSKPIPMLLLTRLNLFKMSAYSYTFQIITMRFKKFANKINRQDDQVTFLLIINKSTDKMIQFKEMNSC